MSEENVKKQLSEMLKGFGLDVAEDQVAQLAKTVFNFIPAFVKATKNPFDDYLIPLLELANPKVMEAIDKIDGKDDPEL